MTSNPLKGWHADARGGVMRIGSDGGPSLVIQDVDAHFDLRQDARNSLLAGTLPNGLAFGKDGAFLVANFGTDRLERMSRSGKSSVLLDQLDGRPLGKVNFCSAG